MIQITPSAPPDWIGGVAPVYSEQQIASLGGSVASNRNYSLVDTVGQVFGGQASLCGGYNLQSGFWTNSASARAPFNFDGDHKTENHQLPR
jgi:hypothetical protein